MAKVAVLKVARKGHNVSTSSTKHLTLDSSKNHLKLVGRYVITLDEPIG